MASTSMQQEEGTKKAASLGGRLRVPRGLAQVLMARLRRYLQRQGGADVWIDSGHSRSGIQGLAVDPPGADSMAEAFSEEVPMQHGW